MITYETIPFWKGLQKSSGFFSCLPYFWISTRVKDGEDLYELLIFISSERNHEREFLNNHTPHVSVANRIGRRVTLQIIDLDYYLLFGNVSLNPAIAHCTIPLPPGYLLGRQAHF